MKQIVYLLLFFILTTTSLVSQGWKSLDVNEQSFLIFEEDYDEYDSKGKTVTFYNKEHNESKDALFAFILEDATGGCNDKSIEKGAYEINGSTITFYTLWKRQGSVDDAPFGGRIMHYELKDGNFSRLSSRLYVETHTEESDEKSGMQFLFKKSISKAEKKRLAEYVTAVEKQFHGKFIFDEEASTLIKEVRSMLKRQIIKVWQRR